MFLDSEEENEEGLFTADEESNKEATENTGLKSLLGDDVNILIFYFNIFHNNYLFAALA